MLADAYMRDSETGVWRRREARQFAYSDGDAVESQIASIVRDCVDPSVFSEELEQAITDWPTLYHLGRGRINLLRPFAASLKGRTLEIGCGCGAITRALGEIGGQVVAVEGSGVRAAIAASRCRDLPNVTVVHDAFDQFECDGQFDTVTLIGVLEYARKYFKVPDGEDPVVGMLRAARRFLRPGGVLLIAIENQLGLKYLAGSPEDHVGIPMYGVEDLYGGADVVTFGAEELRRLLRQAGFPGQEWWYPFPDYKFPVSLFSEAGVAATDCDLSPLLQNSVLLDPQRFPSPAFSIESAWSPVFRNGLAGALANSFAILASDRASANLSETVLAYHYASARKNAYAKQVRFVRNAAGNVSVQHKPLFSEAQEGLAGDFRIEFQEGPFISGQHWQKELVRIVSRPGWRIDELTHWAEVWFSAFRKHAGLSLAGPIDKATPIPGDMFDAVPRNLIVQSDGQGVFIDQEWHYDNVCSLGFVVFRAIGLSFFGVTAVAAPAEASSLKLLDLTLSLASLLGVTLRAADLSAYLQQERELQARVSPAQKSALTEALFSSWRLNVRSAGSSAARLAELEAEVTRKDNELHALASEVHRLESVVTEKVQATQVQSDEIKRLYAAFSEKHERVTTLGSELQSTRQELQRVFEVLTEKEKAISWQSSEIARLEAFAADKQLTVEALCLEQSRLSASLNDKEEALRASALEIERYVQMLRVTNEERERQVAGLQAAIRDTEQRMHAQSIEMTGRIDALQQELSKLAHKMESERHYFYAEIEKRDVLLEQAASHREQLKTELSVATGELGALKRTRWFRLREVLLFHPFGIKKFVHVACIVGAAFVPSALRQRVAPGLATALGLRSATASPSGEAAYRVRVLRQPAKNAPRVVHVIANFMTGGSSRLVVDLIEHLGPQYRQQILTSYIPDPPAYVGVEIEECRFPEDVAPFVEYFGRVTPDFVHVHYWGDCDESWYAKAIEAAKQLGLPVIENVNTPIPPHRSDAVVKYVYVSDYVRQVFGDPDARHVTVYPGSNFELFTRKRGELAPDDCVGMVYRLERDKLNEEAIQPFIRIAQLRPQTHILIVGGGSLLEPFRQAVEEAGVMANFEFTGYVSYDALPGLYRRMSLFVAPVWKESFGQVSPFAMSMKVPVIGYDVGAIGEIIDSPELLAPAADADGLARIAVELLDAPDRRREIGARQQQRAEQHFSVQAMIDHYARLYAETVESRRKEVV